MANKPNLIAIHAVCDFSNPDISVSNINGILKLGGSIQKSSPVKGYVRFTISSDKIKAIKALPGVIELKKVAENETKKVPQRKDPSGKSDNGGS